MTIAKINQHFDCPENYIRVFEVPNKEALAELSAADLKKIGVTLTDTGYVAVIKPVDGEVDKIVAALLKPDVKLCNVAAENLNR